MREGTVCTGCRNRHECPAGWIAAAGIPGVLRPIAAVNEENRLLSSEYRAGVRAHERVNGVNGRTPVGRGSNSRGGCCFCCCLVHHGVMNWYQCRLTFVHIQRPRQISIRHHQSGSSNHAALCNGIGAGLGCGCGDCCARWRCRRIGRLSQSSRSGHNHRHQTGAREHTREVHAA